MSHRKSILKSSSKEAEEEMPRPEEKGGTTEESVNTWSSDLTRTPFAGDGSKDVLKSSTTTPYQTPHDTVATTEGVRFRDATDTWTSQATVRRTAAGSSGRTPVRHNLEHLKKTRLLEKNGHWNIQYVHSRKRQWSDLFTTVVEAQWRYTLLVFILAFVVSWLVFAVVWYVIALAHGDLAHLGDDEWTSCVQYLEDFTSAFLFSLETQHTIGYGKRFINEVCPEGVIILIVQSTVGVLIQCLVAGIVFSKFARSKRRADTLRFSRNAVVSLRDDALCLMYKVGDIRKTHLLNSVVKAHVIQKKVTREGEVIPLHQTDIPVGLETGEETIFMIWPVTLIHRIDEKSPFWGLDADAMATAHFEVIVTIDGTVQSNGMAIQARSSYLPSEILWGHRFKRMLAWSDQLESYTIDHDKFHSTLEVPCPRSSARDIHLAGGVAKLAALAADGGGRGDEDTRGTPMLSLDILNRVLVDPGDVSVPPNTERKIVPKQRNEIFASKRLV